MVNEIDDRFANHSPDLTAALKLAADNDGSLSMNWDSNS